jgi:hypothetical protein
MKPRMRPLVVVTVMLLSRCLQTPIKIAELVVYRLRRKSGCARMYLPKPAGEMFCFCFLQSKLLPCFEASPRFHFDKVH